MDWGGMFGKSVKKSQKAMADKRKEKAKGDGLNDIQKKNLERLQKMADKASEAKKKALIAKIKAIKAGHKKRNKQTESYGGY